MANHEMKDLCCMGKEAHYLCTKYGFIHNECWSLHLSFYLYLHAAFTSPTSFASYLLFTLCVFILICSNINESIYSEGPLKKTFIGFKQTNTNIIRNMKKRVTFQSFHRHVIDCCLDHNDLNFELYWRVQIKHIHSVKLTFPMALQWMRTYLVHVTGGVQFLSLMEWYLLRHVTVALWYNMFSAIFPFLLFLSSSLFSGF